MLEGAEITIQNTKWRLADLTHAHSVSPPPLLLIPFAAYPFSSSFPPCHPYPPQIPSREVDRTEEKFWMEWNPDTKQFFLQFHFRQDIKQGPSGPLTKNPPPKQQQNFPPPPPPPPPRQHQTRTSQIHTCSKRQLFWIGQLVTVFFEAANPQVFGLPTYQLIKSYFLAKSTTCNCIVLYNQVELSS